MKEGHRGIIILLFGILGIIFAAIQKALYDGGTGVTALSNMGLTITEVMIVTIVLFTLVGAIFAVVKS